MEPRRRIENVMTEANREWNSEDRSRMERWRRIRTNGNESGDE